LLDDPLVIAIIALAIFLLFGANQIPKFARALGEARKELTLSSDSRAEENTS
jgi:Sec-independent protein translocase protein TatA